MTSYPNNKRHYKGGVVRVNADQVHVGVPSFILKEAQAAPLSLTATAVRNAAKDLINAIYVCCNAYESLQKGYKQVFKPNPKVNIFLTERNNKDKFTLSQDWRVQKESSNVQLSRSSEDLVVSLLDKLGHNDKESQLDIDVKHAKLAHYQTLQRETLLRIDLLNESKMSDLQKRENYENHLAIKNRNLEHIIQQREIVQSLKQRTQSAKDEAKVSKAEASVIRKQLHPLRQIIASIHKTSHVVKWPKVQDVPASQQRVLITEVREELLSEGFTKYYVSYGKYINSYRYGFRHIMWFNAFLADSGLSDLAIELDVHRIAPEEMEAFNKATQVKVQTQSQNVSSAQADIVQPVALEVDEIVEKPQELVIDGQVAAPLREATSDRSENEAHENAKTEVVEPVTLGKSESSVCEVVNVRESQIAPKPEVAPVVKEMTKMEINLDARAKMRTRIVEIQSAVNHPFIEKQFKENLLREMASLEEQIKKLRTQYNEWKGIVEVTVDPVVPVAAKPVKLPWYKRI